MIPFCILASGRGSNARVLLAAAADAPESMRCVGVVSNKANAPVLDIAREFGVPTRVFRSPRKMGGDALDRALLESVGDLQPELVVMAGFMRIVGERFLGAYPGRVINIHPSLLPAFPGLHTHRRALAAAVPIHGCSVHCATIGVDAGEVIAQALVPVHAGDTEEQLCARVLKVEHRLYPLVLRQIAEGRIRLGEGGVSFAKDCTRLVLHDDFPREMGAAR